MASGQRATDKEICSKLEVDKNEFGKLSRDSKPVGVVSLNRKWFETDSSKDVREIDVVKDTRQENPVQKLQCDDLKLLLTKGLSRAERLIIILYYYEEMTMKEIGITLDLSESRVSQMHSSILTLKNFRKILFLKKIRKKTTVPNHNILKQIQAKSIILSRVKVKITSFLSMVSVGI